LVPERLLRQWRERRREDEAALCQPKPLCLSPRRQRHKCNAQLGFLGEEANILLPPAEAGSRNITDGQRIRVSNTRGMIELIARGDPGMRREVEDRLYPEQPCALQKNPSAMHRLAIFPFS